MKLDATVAGALQGLTECDARDGIRAQEKLQALALEGEVNSKMLCCESIQANQLDHIEDADQKERMKRKPGLHLRSARLCFGLIKLSTTL